MKKVRASVWLMVISATAAWLVMLPSVRMRSAPTENPAHVHLATVTNGSIREITALRGTLRYQQEYAAVAPVSGVVADVYVSPGEYVKKGQALARLDTTAEAAAMSQAYALQGMAAGEGIPDAVDAAALGDTVLQEKAALLEAMTLRAAADGQVIGIPAGKYSGVAAGSPAVLLCSGKQQIICQAAVSDAAEFAAGMQADLLLRGEVCGRAEILYIGAAQADAATGQVVCAVALQPHEKIELPVGAPIEVEIERFSCDDVPVVPLSAVDEDGMVWVVSDGRCWALQTEIVRQDDAHCWVTLPVGTVVVTQPEGLIDGQRIREVQS